MQEKGMFGRGVGSRLLMALGCALLLAGCGPQKIELAPPVFSSAEEEDDSRIESFRRILQDDGLPLTNNEMRAFLSEGSLDKGLSAEELREVQIYFKHYVHSARPIVERFLLRSQSYMSHVRKVFRDRDMPEELAYLAFVESGFNPLAVSRSQAVGLWQFMAPTGRQYGLAQDWWMDERRDPYRSTEAAADYLAKLHTDFNDWFLAIAAYNAGEGKIGRALAGTGCDTFFELCRLNNKLDAKMQLKEETQEYVPRFLAMCKIMRNAEALGFKPADPVNDPKAANIPQLLPVATLQARPGTDLAAFSRELGMEWRDFANYNPAFQRYITPPDRYVQVYVPHHSAPLATALLRDDKLINGGWATYVVQRGDTLAKVSKRTGVPVSVLTKANGNIKSIKVGQRLRVPAKAGSTIMQAANSPAPGAGSSKAVTPKAVSLKPAPANTVVRSPAAQNKATITPNKAEQAGQSKAATTTSAQQKKPTQAALREATHTVKPGDTLASIGREYGQSLSAMRDANNHLANPNALRAGQKINVPKGQNVAQTSPAKAAQKQPAKAQVSTYKVKRGDTMWSIARKFNMPPDELLSLNNMSRSATLSPGDSVRVFN